MFSVGTKVRLRHTGAKGVITEIFEHGMVQVFIPFDEMEIPVFEEDIVLEEEYVEQPTKHTVQEGKQTRSNKVGSPSKKIEHTGKSDGVQIAFDPDYDQEGIVKKFKVFLLNDTAYDYVFGITIVRSNMAPKSFHGKLDASSVYLLDEILYDQLNETPVFTIDCSQLTTAGTSGKQTKSIKIKPKQFFKKVEIAPLLNRPVHLYFLFNPDKVPKPSSGEDLKTYTQKNVRQQPTQKSNFVSYDVHDVKAFANFNMELDLHIERLTNRREKLNNSEMMRLQLSRFDQYMDEAIRLGVERVFIIHGLGTGRLKNAIASRLITMAEVKTFKNEYHPKYGWGATEVIFD